MFEGNPFDFSLEESAREAIADIVGQGDDECIECIEDAILVYFIKKRFYKDRPNINQMNETFAEVRGHISALTQLLSNEQLWEYLIFISVEYFGVDGREQLIGRAPLFLNRTPKLNVLDALEKLDKVCEASIEKQTPGPGRPKGQKDEAVHYLLNDLCVCCEKASCKPLTTKSGNMLERLVKVLNEPLGLGGKLPGLIKATITNRNKKWRKSEKNK